MLGWAALTGPASAAEIAIGAPAPALVVQQLDGARFDLAALRGKVVLVNFWASWCEPCRDEMPVLSDVYKDFHEKGVVVIGVSVDRPRARDAVVRIASGLSYPVGMDQEAETDGFGMPDVLPLTYVLDKQGTVRARLTPENGALTVSALAALVRSML
jgi:peroxiredoxin